MHIRYYLSIVLLASGLHSMDAAIITVQNEVIAPTPEVLAYNLGHFFPGSNAADWWRYSRASGARMFLSPAHFAVNGTVRPGESSVQSVSDFLERRFALRADPLDTDYINWPIIEDRFHVPLSGNNRIIPRYAFERIHQQGGTAMAQMTLSSGAFPITGEDDWQGKWKAWRHYYSLVFYLAREFGIERYTVYNEPNHSNSFIEPAPWLIRLRLASDAARAAIEDVNELYDKTLTLQFAAPVTAGSGGNAYLNYGQPAVGTILTDFRGETTSGNLFQLYAYQAYNHTPNGFANDLTQLQNQVASDLPAEADPLRFAITEYNVHTGARYDDMPETPETLSKAIRFGAITTQLLEQGMDELYAFKFGMTSYPDTRNYPVQKNGMLYTDNDYAPYNYGTMTRSAEVYRLFNKAFAPGRERLARNITGQGADDLLVQISRDPVSGNYYVFSLNPSSSDIGFELDVSALGIPDGNHAIIEDVSPWRTGIIRSVEQVRENRLLPGNQPGQTVWLITLPGKPQKAVSENSNQFVLPVSGDTMVRDGSHSGTSFGHEPTAWVRNDAETPDGRAAVFLQFTLPQDWDPADLQLALLAVTIAPLENSEGRVHAHLYGIDNHDWMETELTWGNAPNLKQKVPPGNQIRHRVVKDAGNTAHILGQLTVDGSQTIVRQIDITDYLKNQTRGKASFLITQDPRWDIDIHQPGVPASWSELPTGDKQPGGLQILTREGENEDHSAARLILIHTARKMLSTRD